MVCLAAYMLAVGTVLKVRNLRGVDFAGGGARYEIQGQSERLA